MSEREPHTQVEGIHIHVRHELRIAHFRILILRKARGTDKGAVHLGFHFLDANDFISAASHQ